MSLIRQPGAGRAECGSGGYQPQCVSAFIPPTMAEQGFIVTLLVLVSQLARLCVSHSSAPEMEWFGILPPNYFTGQINLDLCHLWTLVVLAHLSS